MTARDLQVGDVSCYRSSLWRGRLVQSQRVIDIKQEGCRLSIVLRNLHAPNIDLKTTNVYTDAPVERVFDKHFCDTVHRPQPDGTLKQVFPGVEGK